MKKLALASLITAALAAPALASTNQQSSSTDDTQTQEPITNSDFATLDTDSDGFISQGEADNDNVWTYFVKVDQDTDGQLSASEFELYTSTYASTDLSQVSEEATNAAQAANDMADTATAKTKQDINAIDDKVAMASSTAKSEVDNASNDPVTTSTNAQPKSQANKDDASQLQIDPSASLDANESRYSVRETAAKAKADNASNLAASTKKNAQQKLDDSKNAITQMESDSLGATSVAASVGSATSDANEQRYSVRETAEEAAQEISAHQPKVSSQLSDKDTSILTDKEQASDTDEQAKQNMSANNAAQAESSVDTEVVIHSEGASESAAKVEHKGISQAEVSNNDNSDPSIPAKDYPYVEDEELATTDPQKTQPQGLEGQAASKTVTNKADSMQDEADQQDQITAAAPTQRQFSEIDVNKDGFISREEAQNLQFLANFVNADTDMDDRISESEYKSVTNDNMPTQ